MNIAMNNDIVGKLRQLLATEDDDSVVRIRETKIGSACKARTVLRLSIDMREDEDVETEIDAIPFVMNEELAEQYGTDLVVNYIEEEHAFDVKAAE